ncbi:uncharacterized protein LOC105698805 [Orussus abietinus]|uniref:uncharacterized protein LOC105698805 n=1 Tax=Orussus abietinus TaxID=222816 RepID=UPI000625F362|nr:uncharacterized protein LOC105698805 [Orussus abietinus]
MGGQTPWSSAERRRATRSSIMQTGTHTCIPGSAVLGELQGNESIEEIAESVDELRMKLANMKRLMEERKGSTLGDLSARKRKESSDIIDGNFLSWIFGSALVVILSVSFYAFYNLYHAVLKKFPSRHTEL